MSTKAINRLQDWKILMDEKVIKDHKLIIKSVKVSDKPTKNGGKMYNVSMLHQEAGLELSAVTFSDTIAAELEKFLDKECDLKMSERDYNGAKSYTIVEANGVKNSNFGPRGKGYQQDTVGIERRAAAEYATQLVIAKIPVMEEAELKKVSNTWEAIASDMYVWISARPVKPSDDVLKGAEVVTSSDGFPV